MPRVFRLLPLLPFLLGGCLSLHPQVTPASGAPTFSPERFFAGTTEGVGTLRLRVGRTQLVQVESRGTFMADSTFQLAQTIRRGTSAPSTRTWQMHRTAPGRYTATLTDASGPVTATVEGATLRIRYPMGRFTRMEQRLVLQPGGRTAVNLSTVSFLGVPLARLFETIRRPEAP